MGKSICIKCGSDTFEMEQVRTVNNTTLYFIQCSKCGEIVGTVTDTDTDTDKFIKGVRAKTN